MTRKSDPLLPLIGTAVSLVVLASVIVVFVPRILAALETREDAVVGRPLSPTALVPVWVSHTEDGVALLLEAGRDADVARNFDAALEGGPYRFLHLSVYNFGRDRYVLDVPEAGLASPGGGPNARPAAAVLVADPPARLLAILRGMGLATHLEIERGRRGQVLFVLPGDPAARAAFASGEMRFERRELPRQTLAQWRQAPDWSRFKEF